MVLRLLKQGWRSLCLRHPFLSKHRAPDEVGHQQDNVANDEAGSLGEPTQEANRSELPEYPTCCLRGLRSPGHLDNGIIKTEAYLPDLRTLKDGWAETSINWEDDTAVCEFTLAKRAQAEHGAARLERTEIDRIASQVPDCRGKVRYVRSPLPDNIYHGDILFDMNPPKHVHKMIAAALALYSQFIPPPPARESASPENIPEQVRAPE
jgi:hypothetical protein